MMRQGLLWLSEQKNVFNFVRSNGVARQFARLAGVGPRDDRS